jgi:hypothetical protein
MRPKVSAPLKELETKLQGLGVQLARPEATWRYVRGHKDLPPLLLDAARAVRAKYADVPMVLELVPDPEVDDEEGDTLVLYVRPGKLTQEFFVDLDDWNKVVARRMAKSKAWFIVTV